ncbi:hypothetical protein ACIQXA_33380 [Streptomyces massasporeus]|uniref:hypothetical protein n=1 Tax=Streptomyces massasporeus TaxID=67324 RepID=UPI00380DCAB7
MRSPDDSQLPVADNTAFVPADSKAVAAGVAQLRTCRSHAEVDRVHPSRPALPEPGLRTGGSRRGTVTLLIGADGPSWISAENVAVVDELGAPGPDHRVTVVHHCERPST